MPLSKLSKRKKIIIAISSVALIIPVFTIIGKTTSIFEIDSSQTLYSSVAPSSIVKKGFNNKDFNSPVTNSDLKNQENIVENSSPKSDIVIENEEQNQKKDTQDNSSTTQIYSESLQKAIEKALKTIHGAIQHQIGVITDRIAKYTAQIDEINRYFDENFNNPFYNPSKWNKVDWENLRIMKLRTNLEGSNDPEGKRKQDIAYLEYLKRQLTEKKQLTAEEIKSLKQGLTPTKEDPNVWGYEDESKNPTLNRLKSENKKRLLNIPSWYSRVPSDINALSYNGWDRSDISSNFSDQISGKGFSNSIHIYSYKPNQTNEEFGSRKEFKVIVLDADDNKAFEQFNEILNEVTKKDKEIKGVVLKNVGSRNSSQNVNKILEKLPDSVEKLTLFLEDYNGTNNLRGLENKKLRELELYSNKNTINENWKINPNSLKNVDFISFDYNNQASFNDPNSKIAGSIIFNTLRWDKDDDINKVNEGLKIVFESKINQRVFQGSMGGKGGYPINLDFSSTDKIKTLKGIKFDELDKAFDEKIKKWEYDPFALDNYLGFKKIKFKNITFKGEMVGGQKAFKAQLSDFDKSYFSERLTFGEPSMPPGPNIYIKNNGEDYNEIPMYLTGNGYTDDAKAQILAFLNATNRGGNRRINKIYVESQEIKNKLGGSIKDVLVEVKNANTNSSSSNSTGGVKGLS